MAKIGIVGTVCGTKIWTIMKMEKENIPIDYIGGTSQGAFMGK